MVYPAIPRSVRNYGLYSSRTKGEAVKDDNLPTAALSGGNVTQIVCRKHGKSFDTVIP
jgi:hypothetical protein